MAAFEILVKSVQKLMDVNPGLCMQLRGYVYDVIGCCQEVHREMGPFLNEYIYQDALGISLQEHGVKDFVREYYFKTEFHGKELGHTHKVDFFVRSKIYVECKAINALGAEQRQQLWNYMRLSGVRIGILYNFAPFHDQCERYYLDIEKQIMYAF